MTQTRLPRHRKWHNLARPVTPVDPPPVTPTTPAAFARREVTDVTSWQNGSGQFSKVATVMFRWNDYETAEGSYSSTIESSMATSFDHAHANDYLILIRVFCGADAPCGRPSDATFPSWMTSSSGHPVQVITTKALDSGGGATEGDLIHIPLAWDVNYRYHYDRLLTHLNGFLSGIDAGGDARRNHVLFIPASMPTELGTEMALGYGSVDPTFNRAAWDAVSTETQRRSLYTQAWKDTIDDHRLLLPGLRVGLAGQHLFNDGFTGADDIVQTKGAFDLVAMTTDLRPNFSTWGVNQHDFLLKGKAAGCYMGIQTAGESAAPQGQSYVDAAEQALIDYGLRFHETYTTAYTSTTVRTLSASGGWPGDNVTTATYLANHASDLQSRLVAT